MNRFSSLDAFRGATVALMILVNNPGSWSYVYPPLQHAKWHGCTPTDLVFPFFLFAVGNAMAFVMPKYRSNGEFWGKVLKRSSLIFLIGLFLNWFPIFQWVEGHLEWKPLDKLRILGVLQRIALAYFFAAVIVYHLRLAGTIILSSFLLLIYWGMCYAFGASGDPYSLHGYFGTSVDKVILGESHLYRGEGVAFDPEGLMSTVPSIVQVVIGYLAGKHIITKGKNNDMLSELFVVALLLIFVAFIWDLGFPINKKIWTSSYVLYTSGLAICVIGIMIYWIELKGKSLWLTGFFEVFGRNPLFIYVLSGIWIDLYFLFRVPSETKDGATNYVNGYSWLFEHVFQPIFGNYGGSLTFAIAHVLLFWSIGKVMDKKRIYIRV